MLIFLCWMLQIQQQLFLSDVAFKFRILPLPHAQSLKIIAYNVLREICWGLGKPNRPI